MCDTRDLGYFSDPAAEFCEKRPVIVIFDNFPGGIGLTAKLFEIINLVFIQCIEVIKNCPCLDGCPSCVGPAGENGSGGKNDALLLAKLLSQGIHE
jgi:DEAD/DEAH box helicase domain-containing protein